MAIHITAPAQTSGAKSNPHLAIEVIPLPDAVSYNQNLPVFVHDYYANSHEIREFFPALVERLRTRTYIHEGGAKDALMARVFFLTQEMLEMARVREQQSRMQVSVIFFTLAAAISAAAAVTAVNVNPKRIAAAEVATAATVLIGALGNGIHSLLKKRENSVKKNRDILRTELIGAEVVIKDLCEVYDLDFDLKSETASIWEMVDDRATHVAVREKVSALNKSFRRLQRKARSSSSDVSSAREAVLQSIIRNSIELN